MGKPACALSSFIPLLPTARETVPGASALRAPAPPSGHGRSPAARPPRRARRPRASVRGRDRRRGLSSLTLVDVAQPSSVDVERPGLERVLLAVDPCGNQLVSPCLSACRNALTISGSGVPIGNT